MSQRYTMDEPAQRVRGLKAATDAVKRKRLVVLPTDTVYGIGADAFSPDAVAALLEAKGRGRGMPVPVLVGSPSTLSGIARAVTGEGRDLVEAFWPGGLTVVCHQQRSLAWDLGDTDGTVAVRMPLHPVAIELLRETGPMAVSSANKTGRPPASTCDEARDQLGELVRVYLDGGPSGDPVPSSIVDITGDHPVLVREGATPYELLLEVAPSLTRLHPVAT